MRHSRGFTLLEVLVAFVIAAMAFAVLFRIAGTSFGTSRTAGRYEEAVSRARSHLAALGADIKATEGEMTGDDGDGYRWRIGIAPVATTKPPPESDDEDNPGITAPPDPITLFAVTVGISWTEDGRKRELVLRTERVGFAAPGSNG
jgi:general secretion pathway protein I